MKIIWTKSLVLQIFCRIVIQTKVIFITEQSFFFKTALLTPECLKEGNFLHKSLSNCKRKVFEGKKMKLKKLYLIDQPCSAVSSYLKRLVTNRFVSLCRASSRERGLVAVGSKRYSERTSNRWKEINSFLIFLVFKRL